jgi:hypothetical protein
MMASAPAATATRAFSSSLSMLVSSRLVPMLALTLVRSPLPTASGVPLVCLTFWQMMAVPSAMRWRRTSGSIPFDGGRLLHFVGNDALTGEFELGHWNLSNKFKVSG